MFLIELSYTAPLEQVDALLAAHVAYLDDAYAAGHFVLSGRKEPRMVALFWQLCHPAPRWTRCSHTIRFTKRAWRSIA